MGHTSEDLRFIGILNRIVIWCPDGVEYEPDQLLPHACLRI